MVEGENLVPTQISRQRLFRNLFSRAKGLIETPSLPVNLQHEHLNSFLDAQQMTRREFIETAAISLSIPATLNTLHQWQDRSDPADDVCQDNIVDISEDEEFLERGVFHSGDPEFSTYMVEYMNGEISDSANWLRLNKDLKWEKTQGYSPFDYNFGILAFGKTDEMDKAMVYFAKVAVILEEFLNPRLDKALKIIKAQEPNLYNDVQSLNKIYSGREDVRVMVNAFHDFPMPVTRDRRSLDGEWYNYLPMNGRADYKPVTDSLAYRNDPAKMALTEIALMTGGPDNYDSGTSFDWEDTVYVAADPDKSDPYFTAIACLHELSHLRGYSQGLTEAYIFPETAARPNAELLKEADFAPGGSVSNGFTLDPDYPGAQLTHLTCNNKPVYAKGPFGVNNDSGRTATRTIMGAARPYKDSLRFSPEDEEKFINGMAQRLIQEWKNLTSGFQG